MTAVRWPTDFVALDRGRLMVRPDAVAAFLDRGWRTLDAVMAAEVDVVRRVGERDNCRIELGGRPAFLKRHWEPNGSRFVVPPGRQEADAVGWCVDAGVPTMSLIAAGADGERNDRKSFFLSEAVPSGIPADDVWKANPDRRTRERITTALAETARRFHDAGLFHRDFYWCHFFLRPTAGGAFVAHLIDLQRVLRRPFLSWRWRVKDLGQFWYSAPSDVTDDDREAWFSLYSGRGRRHATQWAARVRAGFYRFKEGAA
jgi:heptose I phosphotransferase